MCLGNYKFLLVISMVLYNDIIYFLMQSIKKSECPKELESADKKSAVNVNLIRRNENYRVSFLSEFFGLYLSNLWSVWIDLFDFIY
jgi:hypothetical protein